MPHYELIQQDLELGTGRWRGDKDIIGKRSTRHALGEGTGKSPASLCCIETTGTWHAFIDHVCDTSCRWWSWGGKSARWSLGGRIAATVLEGSVSSAGATTSTPQERTTRQRPCRHVLVRSPYAADRSGTSARGALDWETPETRGDQPGEMGTLLTGAAAAPAALSRGNWRRVFPELSAAEGPQSEMLGQNDRVSSGSGAARVWETAGTKAASATSRLALT